jgi:hypothetical protein
MSGAELVAKRLAYEFLRDGKYNATVGPVEVRRLVSAASTSAVAISHDELDGFGNISVQSVGFSEGEDGPTVHIYLTRGTNALIRSLPDEIDGVRVRAHRMGPINVKPDAAGTATNFGHLFERNGRVCCGSSCGPTTESSVGTFGAIVRRSRDNELYLLSNNHVFAGCNHVPRDVPILSPGATDGRAGIRAPGEIGRHWDIHEMRSGDPNFVNPCDADLALARVVDHRVVSSWQGDAADGYDTPASSIEPEPGMAVMKFGRTTHLKFGEVEAKVSTPTPVSYTAKHFKGVVWFQDVWTIAAANGEPFALPGDSGSLVVTDDGKHAVGLVFAANRTGEYAWMIPMACIARSFGGLSLVSGHGV